MLDRVRLAAKAVRSRRRSLPHARLRVTPAVHQQLATELLHGTDLLPEGVILDKIAGVRVEVDADVPDPGWILESWR